MEEHDGTAGRAAAKAWLLKRVAELDLEGGPERRHETLMERAEDWGVPRVEAEAVYALAEEEGLDPELGLLVRAAGLGVMEFEPDVDELESGLQLPPPEWVAGTDLAPEEARRERRLRLSFRRLRTMLASSSSAAEAADRFLHEPDVVDAAY
jgi:hypothetical protein